MDTITHNAFGEWPWHQARLFAHVEDSSKLTDDPQRQNPSLPYKLNKHGPKERETQSHKSLAVVQSLSCFRLFVTPWTAAQKAALSFTISQSLLKLPLSQWCHPTISSCVIPFSSCLQSFPALGSFPVSQFFASGGQSIGTSASASVLPMNIQDWFPLGWTGWIFSQESSLLPRYSNVHLLRVLPWQADSLPLAPPGKSKYIIPKIKFYFSW